MTCGLFMKSIRRDVGIRTGDSGTFTLFEHLKFVTLGYGINEILTAAVLGKKTYIYFLIFGANIVTIVERRKIRLAI